MSNPTSALNYLQMSRPDKILAAAIVEYLPERTLLDSNCQETLKTIINLAHVQLKSMGRIADIPFCHPSRAYLAKKIGKSEATIKRGLTNLRNMGIVVEQQTRRKSGRYTTNRYWFGPRLLEILTAFFKKFSPWVRAMTHGNLNRRYYKSNRRASIKIKSLQKDPSPNYHREIGQEWKKNLEKWQEESSSQMNDPQILASLTEMFTKARWEHLHRDIRGD